MKDDLSRDVTRIVAEVIEFEESELWEKRSQSFVEELGVDSMLALEILAVLEKRFRIEIPEEDILELSSLDATIALVQSKLASATA